MLLQMMAHLNLSIIFHKVLRYVFIKLANSLMNLRIKKKDQYLTSLFLLAVLVNSHRFCRHLLVR
jgi:triacylglycerol esterase/lipase EstA (alpha/beta hydrolase family)